MRIEIFFLLLFLDYVTGTLYKKRGLIPERIQIISKDESPSLLNCATRCAVRKSEFVYDKNVCTCLVHLDDNDKTGTKGDTMAGTFYKRTNIKGLEMKNKETTYTFFKVEQTIIKNHLVTTIPVLYKIYNVTFDLYATKWSTSADYTNILHLTIGESARRYGDRIPMISIRNWSRTFHIANAVNGDMNYHSDTMKTYPLNTWIKLRVQQIRENGKYAYSTYINNEQIHQVVNTKPQVFYNVKVYCSSPWMEPQEGKVKNLIINTKPS